MGDVRSGARARVNGPLTARSRRGLGYREDDTVIPPFFAPTRTEPWPAVPVPPTAILSIAIAGVPSRMWFARQLPHSWPRALLSYTLELRPSVHSKK